MNYMLRVAGPTLQFFGPFPTSDEARLHGDRYCQDYRYEAVDAQLAAQEQATMTKPRYPYQFRVAHVDGSITNHKTFAAAEKTWRVGDVVYLWRDGRWRIWTSAGLF